MFESCLSVILFSHCFHRFFFPFLPQFFKQSSFANDELGAERMELSFTSKVSGLSFTHPCFSLFFVCVCVVDFLFSSHDHSHQFPFLYIFLNVLFVHFSDNAGVIVNNKGEMKGSGIAGPVAKECSELWPRIAANAGAVV